MHWYAFYCTKRIYFLTQNDFYVTLYIDFFRCRCHRSDFWIRRNCRWRSILCPNSVLHIRPIVSHLLHRASSEKCATESQVRKSILFLCSYHLVLHITYDIFFVVKAILCDWTFFTFGFSCDTYISAV